ncbi:hypothetical protein [Streptosporangium sandarakinum]
MTPRKRAACPVCGLSYAISRAGRIGRHNGVNRAGFSTGQLCEGVGQLVPRGSGMTADDWNAAHPIGTPVLAWPGTREFEPLKTHTRTPAWTLGHGAAVVSVEGYAGGIALTHIEPVPGLCRAVSEHGDVCVNPENHTGLCRSGVGRKHVSSPEKASKPWVWDRSAAVARAAAPTPEETL